MQDLGYVYDPAGNITHIQDDAQQTLFFKNQVVTPSGDYTYDAVYRLRRAEGREHIGQASQPETTWNDDGRLHLPHPSDGQAMRRYAEQYNYDAVGNLPRACAHRRERRLDAPLQLRRSQPDRARHGQQPAEQCRGRRRAARAVRLRRPRQHDRDGRIFRAWSGTSSDQLRRVGSRWRRDGLLRLRRRWSSGCARWSSATPGTSSRNGSTSAGFEIFRRRNAAGAVSLERETPARDGRRPAHRARRHAHPGGRSRGSGPAGPLISSATISARPRSSSTTPATSSATRSTTRTGPPRTKPDAVSLR